MIIGLGGASYTTPTLSEQFREAVEVNKEKRLRGLNAMCDDTIARRIAEFTAKHKPEDGSPQEIADFYDKLRAYMFMLSQIAFKEQNEMLFSFGGGEADEENHIQQPHVIKAYEQMIMVDNSGISATN